jgi:hypothetical protein
MSSKNVDLSFYYKYGESSSSITLDNILTYCYELDENASPAIYRLKYLNRLFPDLNHKVFELNLDESLICCNKY